MSLAVMSSRYLEANNKTIKRRFKTLPGGGVKRQHGFGNDPLFLTLSHLFEHKFVKRRVLYKAVVQKRKEAETAAQQRQKEQADVTLTMTERDVADED
jgi:hypothetical protein